MWMVLPSVNQSWCTPRDSGPEQSKKLMLFGFSGVEMSNSSNPAGFSPGSLVWYATASMSPTVSSEFDRMCDCGRSRRATILGFFGSVTSTAVKFYGALSCASHRMRRPSLVSCIDMPSPMPPNPSSVLCERSLKFQIIELSVAGIPLSSEVLVLWVGLVAQRVVDWAAGQFRNGAHRGAGNAPHRIVGAVRMRRDG